MRILYVNTSDAEGGAARATLSLMEAESRRGHEVCLAVGVKTSADARVFAVPQNDSLPAWSRLWSRAAQRLDGQGHVRGAARVQALLKWLGRSPRQRHLAQGKEDFDHPGSWRMLESAPWMPDIVHLHNLHGGYFDLRCLPKLTETVPTVITLHDQWMLTGHCAYSFDCERWRCGCGSCPNLRTYPAIKRDATASNLRRKGRIYASSKLFVAAPSEWLTQQVRHSCLMSAAQEVRRIANGINLTCFRPGDKAQARKSLGIPSDAFVVLVSGNRIRRNPFKGYSILQEVASRLPVSPKSVRVHILGDEGPDEKQGNTSFHFYSYVHDVGALVLHQQAADMYLHTALAENFPYTVMEAMACGLPVIAFALGGIPEQIRSILPCKDSPATQQDATGILVEPRDAKAMSEAILGLAQDKPLRLALGRNAAADARRRFDMERCADAYLDWYDEILDAANR